MKHFLLFLIFPFFIFSQKQEIKTSSDFIIHYLSDDDTYHSLKLKYGISKRKIIKLNPELKKCKFLSDCPEVLEIKIFIKDQSLLVNNLVGDTISNIDSLFLKEYLNDFSVVPDLILNSLNDTLISERKDTIVNISILLPFFSNSTDSIISSYPFDKIKKTNFHRESRISLDFYSGLLFSFNEFFDDTNLKLNLNVFDTYHSIDTLKNMLTYNDLNSMDIIFGPLYQENFDFISNKITNSNITLVSPLQSNSINKDYNQNKIYFFESDRVEKISYTANYIYNRFIKELSSNSVSIFLKEDEKKERKIISDHLKEWKSNVVYYEIDTPTISEFMTDEEINSLSGIFFIPSNDPVFVSDIISRLHALKDGSMVVFCSDDILDFSLIPHSELYDLNVRFFSESKPFFDKSDFIKSFYEYFSIHPQNKYVYQGYKCGLYFLKNFFGNLISSEKSFFGTYYNFVLKENNIYRNEAFKLWKYEKHSIVEMLETNENQ